MAQGFTDKSWREALRMENPPKEIREADVVSLPRFEPLDEDVTYLRPHANEELNSRMPSTLAAESWEVRWHSELHDRLFPDFLMTDGRRILIQGDSEWQLFDMDGKLLEAGPLGYSGVVLDRVNKVFYLVDQLGYLSTWNLADGSMAFLMGIDYADDFFRSFFTRRGQNMLIVGIQRELEADGPPPNYSLIQVLDLGDPMKISDDHDLTSLQTRAEMVRYSTLLLAAMHEETLVIAAQDYLYFADLDLRIDNVLSGNFTPLAMSLDEAMNIYLIVLTEEDHYALWLVTPEGERLMNIEIPEVPDYVYTPPIVGYDHQVYVTLEDRIMAISPQGGVLWDEYLPEPVAGAVVTANDQLLVSVGSMLLAFDEKGERRTLYVFEGEELVTQPILTERERIIVATEESLYYLVPKP